MKRREFLNCSIGALSAFATQSSLAEENYSSRKHLILIELQGGNDGLNTVIPIHSKEYRSLRPKLAISSDSAIHVDEKTGFHPAFSALLPAWQNEEVAVIQGVGYANPVRSHFRSHDIMATASDANQQLKTGWLSNLQLVLENDMLTAITFNGRSAPIKGGQNLYLSMNRLLKFSKYELPVAPSVVANSTAAERWINLTQKVTRDYQLRLNEKSVAAEDAIYPAHTLGRQASDAAALLKAGIAPPVLKLHQSGYDTHAGQLPNHFRLLAQFADTITALRKDLTEAGMWDQVLISTTSEFGRRAAENASGGTDHGTAAPQFIIGGRIKGGLYGKAPDLVNLVNEDVEHTIDFRVTYSTILKKWFGLEDASINNRDFHTLDFVHTS